MVIRKSRFTFNFFQIVFDFNFELDSIVTCLACKDVVMDFYLVKAILGEF